jgi:hypothetical protein
MESFLNALSPDEHNTVRLWYMEEILNIRDEDVRRDRVCLVQELWRNMDQQEKDCVVHAIKSAHLHYTTRTTVPPLRADTPRQALLVALFSPRLRCRFLKKRGIYDLAAR